MGIMSLLLFVNTAYGVSVKPKKSSPGCQKNLEMCTEDLGTCETDLGTCQTATCSNDIAEFGEECDGENLQGATCQSEGFM